MREATVDVSIDYNYRTRHYRAPLYRRSLKGALRALAWVLTILTVGLATAMTALIGCSYLECWTLF